MRDIIERLRSHTELGTALEDEAADEIERLQDEVQKAFEYGYNSGHMDSCMLAWKEYCGVKE